MLTDSVQRLSGVGPRIEEKLNQIGILRIQDLLFYLPLRYQDRTRLSRIGELMPNQEALVEGGIESVRVVFGRQRSLQCIINDGTGTLALKFFHFSKAQQQRFNKLDVLRCYGRIRQGRYALEMSHPEYTHIDPAEAPPVAECLTAIYPLTGGLRQRSIQKLCLQALEILFLNKDDLGELIPAEILAASNLPDLVSALNYVHHPPPNADLQLLKDMRDLNQQRLCFEELLSHHLALQQLRRNKRSLRSFPLSGSGDLLDGFINILGFSLTSAQKKVLAEIEQDLRKSTPMLRLLQGEVGSGKTVVAACAALHALEAGYQAALMVPTELLAEQHFHNFSKWFSCLNTGDMEIEVLLIKGKSTKAERAANADILNNKKRVIAIGTHALFQESVRLTNIGMVIIDEQHRFGVDQRLALLDKSKDHIYMPHQLIMTATPIPRTLAMTVYADMDLSIIEGLPPGRQAVDTIVIPETRRDDVIARVKAACRRGDQVYWVCTLIEESEVLQCQTAERLFKKLVDELPDISIGLLHGKMKNNERLPVINAFKENKIQLLVTTTVIEVGIDVPNASIMIIENAERLGLFQMHQLRGRVGRGNIKSSCLLMYSPPLSSLASERLRTLRNKSDGLAIAEKDFELRGCGDLTGTRQTGLPNFRIANLYRDAGLLADIQHAAVILQRQYPHHIKPLIDRWLGRREIYSNV